MDDESVSICLRLAREAAGITLAGMAGRTNFSKSYLGNVETGRRAATAGVVLAYESALGDSMERRGLLSGLAASVVAPAAVTELIQRGFAAALRGRTAVEDWAATAAGYDRQYMRVGSVELQRRLAGDLVVLQQHLETPQLWATAARLLTVYGMTVPSTDGGKGTAAWFRMAALAADRSGDRSVQVWVRGRSALALAYEGRALPLARDLADSALAMTDRPCLGRLNALLAKAQAAAVVGDRGAAVGLFDDARRVLDAIGPQEEMSDTAVPEWRFHTFASMLLSRLGDPKADAAQEAADRTRPAELTRFATHIELHRGLMMAKAGDLAGGTAYARAAMAKLPPERHTISLRMVMAEINRAARGRRALPSTA